jgi:asparagine N-glycosylation enzyme membrane subunit Stt3
LPAVGLLLTPFRYLIDVSDFAYWFDADLISGPGFSVAALLGFQLIFNIVIVVLWGLLTWSFFRRRSSVPVLFVVYIAIIFLFVVVDTALTDQLIPERLAGPDSEGSPEVVIPVFIGAAIWIPYFLKSERVKRVFIRRRTSPAPESQELTPV